MAASPGDLCADHDDCRFWRLTGLQCARYFGRLAGYHRRQLAQMEAEVEETDRQVRLWGWLVAASVVLTVLIALSAVPNVD